MRFVASISDAPDVDRAVEELLRPIDARVTPGMVDLAMVFVSGHFADSFQDVADRLHSALPGAVLIGCTAEGTIGVDRELERMPSMSLLAASLPDVLIRPFYLTQESLESATGIDEWERMTGVSAESAPTFVALADPFRFAVHHFVDQLNEFFPGAPLVGGVASSARHPGENRLVLNGEVFDQGAVGLALTGRLGVRTVVSQGCRPIGRPFVITRAERNIVRELGGKSALEQLHSVLVGLTEEDERLARQSLLVGRVIDEYKATFGRGDFLIHNIIGADRASGAIGIAGRARVGATVQFHVRDAESADDDLRSLLKPLAGFAVRGAMLFGCNGRGSQMWPRAGHDVGVVRELLGDVPVAGFFCGGEFGPVGGRNFIHGFTASIALFYEPADLPKSEA